MAKTEKKTAEKGGKTPEKKNTKNTKGKSAPKKNASYVKEPKEQLGESKTYAEKQQTYALCFISVGILLCCFALIPGIKVWASIRGFLFAVCGNGFFLLTLLMFVFGIIAATNKFKKNPSSFVYLSILLTCLFSSIIHICTNTVADGGFSEWWLQLSKSATTGWFVSENGMHLTGGIMGAAVGGLLLQAFGKTAALATVIILFLANTMLLTGLTFNIIGASVKDVFLILKDKYLKYREVRKAEQEELNKRLEEERLRDERDKALIAQAMAEKQEQEEMERRARMEAERRAAEEAQEKARLEEERRAAEETQEKARFEEERRRAEAEALRQLEYSEAPIAEKKTEESSIASVQADIMASLDEIFAFREKTEPETNDDPIAHSNNPNFRFTDPFLDVSSSAEPTTVPMPESPTASVAESFTVTPEPKIETAKPDFEGAEQISFSDSETDDIVRRANEEANEKQKENMESVRKFKDSEKPRLEYRLPPITCLDPPKFTKGDDFTAEMKSTSQKLLETLKSFGVETSLVGVSRGPSVTRYELQPAPGVKISKITNLSDDIALNLASSGVRIEAPIPNKSAVGIEIPNKNKSMVTLREIISSPEFQKAKSKLNVALGKDITGNVTCADLAKMPHLLIAGTTGSGKSVCLNCMIVSILYNATPSQVKLLMIDPKQVEFSVYNGIPHLLVPVISNVRKAAGALAWAVTEMENRYKTFSECTVRDIFGYNKYCQSHPELEPMSQIVIFIDELNDLMMISPKEVEDSICRLAQKARAAGMHLVVATQRPSVDVITGIIKANIPSRISLSVSSQVDSRTILDMIGAEKLLGNGDMLYNPVGNSKPTRIQGAYLSDNERERIVDFIKSQESCEYDDAVMEEIERQATADSKKGGFDDDEDDERDPMLEAAIEVVVELGQASTTLLQRKLRLGYARAARIMDQLETNGVVGPSEGSKPRKVLISKAQLLEMKAYVDNTDEE